MLTATQTVPSAHTLTVDRQYGAILEGSWVPAPRFVLRRNRVLPLIENLPQGRVIEVGCGAGALLRELAALGHECIGLETSDDAVAVARQMLANFPNARVLGTTEAGWKEQFDILMAFEVLEHIEDDHSALREWVRWLKPGGKVIISMPAHMAKWSSRDTWAGHYRRYGKEDMIGLAQGAGLQIEKLECYGFPLASVTNWLTNLSVRGEDYAGGAASRTEATSASGTDRKTATRYFELQRSLFGRLVMEAACQAQRPFLNMPFGDGYLLAATKL